MKCGRRNHGSQERVSLEADTHLRLPTHHEYRRPILLGSRLQTTALRTGKSARSALPKGVFCWVSFGQEVQHLVPHLRPAAISPMKPHHHNSAKPQGVLQTQPQLHWNRSGVAKWPKRGGSSRDHWFTSKWTGGHSYLKVVQATYC